MLILQSAREAAVREVQTMVSLSGPDSLSRLAKLREGYEQQLAGVEVQLSLAAGRQADEAKAVLTLVDRCATYIVSSTYSGGSSQW